MDSSILKKILLVITLIFLLVITGCGGDKEAGSPDRPFAFVSWGGSFGDNIENAAVKAWAEEENIQYVHISPTDYGKIRAMAETGIIEWDVVDGDDLGLFLVDSYGVLEEFDLNIVDTTGIPDEFLHKGGSYFIGYSTVLAYNTDVFAPGQEPKTWADFWDVENFPGKRGLYDSPHHNIEIALLADGVPVDQIYPIDEAKLERAFRKLDEIKPHVIFWETGAVAPQIVADGEVSMTSGWNGRFNVVIDEGAPVAYTFNQGVLGFDAIFVLKNSPYREAAMRLVNYLLSAEVQAKIVETMPYGPVNLDAFNYLPDDYAKILPTYPENLEKQVISDAEWWGEMYDPLTERFLEWKIE